MRVLITGSAGFLGSHLVTHLLARGHDVMGIDLQPDHRSPRAWQHDLRLPLEWPADAHFDVAVHLASSVGGFLHNAQTTGLEANERLLAERLAELCAAVRCRRVIYSSTLCVYDNRDDVDLGPLSRLDQRTPYARAKAQTERFLADTIPELVVLRLTNLFGAEQAVKGGTTGTSHVIPDLLRKIKTDDCLDVLGDGSQVRNFLHVSDAAELIASLLKSPVTGYFNVRSELQLSISELARELLRFSGTDKPVRYHPEYLRYEPPPLKPFDLTPLHALGWRPRVSSIGEGLKC